MGQDIGKVFLVGAGPGDPGLLTLKGARLLEQADVVVYDALSSPRLLALAPAARHIYVGKRSSAHTLTQEQINALLIDEARKGLRVVRLKGGDPFVFGRGGEECEALRHAGIEFEVVPGITAALAAPAYAGIPVTHRDFNSTFTFVTGHEKDNAGTEENSSDIDWSALARLPALAFYMGAKSLGRITARLIEHGMDPQMPAASIQWGTTPRQRTIVATLATLAAAVERARLAPPMLTIIGRVVSLRPALDWFERQPLFGQTIVVTRTRQQASSLSEKLESLGAAVLEAPTIEIHPPRDPSPINRALAHLHEYDWIIFTSVNGVAETKRKLLDFGLDARVFGKARIAAIGEATAEAIRQQLCLSVALCPASFVAEALADELERRGEISGRKFLLLRADIARPVLRDRLDAAGAAQVHDVAVYETRPAASLAPELLEALTAGEVHWITFTSSSTAVNFTQLLGADYKTRLGGIKLASIGPITTAALEKLGLTPTVQAERFDLDGLVAAILDHSTRAGARP